MLGGTAERYQRELECDRELFEVIALDAQGVPQRRTTARHAANLLADASQKGGASEAAADGERRKPSCVKNAATLIVELASQPGAAQQKAKAGRNTKPA